MLGVDSAGGCGRTRRARGPASAPCWRRGRWTTCAAGSKRTRPPAARTRTQRSTSSSYRKKPSSKPETASNARRRIMRHEPDTQSGSDGTSERSCAIRRASGSRRATPRTRRRCRHSASGVSAGPNETCAVPSRLSVRGPTIATSGRVSSTRASASTAPAATSASLFRKSRYGAVARRAAVAGGAEAEVRSLRSSRTAGKSRATRSAEPSCWRCRRRSSPGRGRPRSPARTGRPRGRRASRTRRPPPTRAASRALARGVGERVPREAGRLRPGMARGQGTPRATRSPRSAPSSSTRASAPASAASSSSGTVSAAPANTSSCAGRSLTIDGHAARHRLQRGQAEALVLGQEHGHVRRGVAVGQPGLGREARVAHRPREPQPRGQRGPVPRRVRAQVAHDLEAHARMAPPQQRDRAQQHGQPPAAEHGADREHERPVEPEPRARAASRSGGGSRSSSAPWGIDTIRGAASGKRSQSSRRENSEHRQHAPRRADGERHRQPPSQPLAPGEVAGQRVERQVVHGGDARQVEPERAGVRRAEQHVERVAPRGRGQAALLPPSRPGRARGRARTSTFGWSSTASAGASPLKYARTVSPWSRVNARRRLRR